MAREIFTMLCSYEAEAGRKTDISTSRKAHGKASSETGSKAGTHAVRVGQAAPTCYRDMNIDHRTVLDCSNSFQHPSCPYWSVPSPPQCAPVVLITNTQSFIPPKNVSKWEREKEKWIGRPGWGIGGHRGRGRGTTKKGEETKRDIDCDKRDRHWTATATHRLKPHGPWPVPTWPNMGIWGHNTVLHLLNFSPLPSGPGWPCSCHPPYAPVVLVETKAWKQWNDIC